MKIKISISLDNRTLENVEDLVIRNNAFRNKSHFMELAAQKYLEVLKDDQ